MVGLSLSLPCLSDKLCFLKQSARGGEVWHEQQTRGKYEVQICYSPLILTTVNTVTGFKKCEATFDLLCILLLLSFITENCHFKHALKVVRCSGYWSAIVFK
jgi:hypothetical protein